MIFKDYYKILGLENSKVTIEEIKAAYREEAKKYHPDVNIGNKNAEERFKDINESYKVLLDFAAKKKYDRMWNTHVRKRKSSYEESKRGKESTFSDFFNMFFGANEIAEEKKQETAKGKRIPIKGENIETQINISIPDAFYGLEKKISLRTVGGKMKTFCVQIPAGIRNGEKIRLLGQGKQGENGGRNGDLFIKIEIESNKKYRLDSCDLYTDLLITPWEAALGTRVNVDSIDETVAIYIPQGIESGEKVRIPAKGYKDGKGGRGDLVAEVKIMVPKKMSDQERELFKKLNEISKFDPRTIYS